MTMKDIGYGIVIIGIVLIIIFGVGWAGSEMTAHYEERAFSYEWNHQNRQIVGVMDSIERMIRIIKE